MRARLMFGLALAAAALASPATAPAVVVNIAGHTDRPLRYQPDNGDFVIVNGSEFFNRPLYADHSAFRVDGGDRPEFSLYVPGHGGNLRLGIQAEAGAIWLHDASRIVARYRAGSMLYDINDSLLADGTLHLAVLPLPDAQGFIVRAELTGTTGAVSLFYAYGGADGRRGSRAGDIGTEREPVSQFFQVRPENARDNWFTLDGSTFLLHSRIATILGLASPGTQFGLADATYWNSLPQLLASAAPTTPPTLPLVLGHATLAPDLPVYLELEKLSGDDDARADLTTYHEAAPGQSAGPAAAPTPASLAQPVARRPENLALVFAAAERYRQQLASQVTVETPDPFLNAAVPALCVAADAVWDEADGVVLHGAVAWRTKLPGWRGPYANDALGWHDRARRDFDYWAARQNTDPVPNLTPVPDATFSFSRDETALHSNGDVANSHYNMNLVYLDAVLRNLLWTGDLGYARQMWPVIQRDLAWEKRLFRRPFGTNGFPLYEGYADIWASDDLEYEGGGATHTTAFLLYHNLMAARLARLLGEDPAPYENEAEAIRVAMGNELWLTNQGWFAESKDLLGLQATHPSAALWTFYHTVDSDATTPLEGWQMSRFVDTQIAHIPVRGPGVPDNGYFTLPTTNWMPYSWSVNNVVMAEAAHTALAYWQIGRDDVAYRLFMGSVFDSMYLGLCPGNAGMTTAFDMARGESQRDFADAAGVLSRALVEGLFGVRPDALAGELVVRPGFPPEWDRASISHPDFNFSYERGGVTESARVVPTTVPSARPLQPPTVHQDKILTETFSETYTIEPKFAGAMALRLQIPARRDQIASITLNGGAATWRALNEAVGDPRVEITGPVASKYVVVIAWTGAAPATASAPAIVPAGGELRVSVAPANLLEINDPQGALNQLNADAHSFRATAVGLVGHRSVFAKVQQGPLIWWLPVFFEIRPPYEIVPDPAQDAGQIRFTLRNNTPAPLAGNATVTAGGVAAVVSLSVPAFGESPPLARPTSGLLPGTNPVSIRLPGGGVVTGDITDWHIVANAAPANFTTVDLTPIFNDRVTQIFQHSYQTPRSMYASLAIPERGLGTWCRWNITAEIDDHGLRNVSGTQGGRLILPQGIPFATPGPGAAPNIAFTSQWDNFPRAVTVPLSGRAAHAYFLLAGSTNSMQSRLENGEIVVAYADGSTTRLALVNPTNWWPIDEDYFMDDYAFRRPDPIPPRVNLRTGEVRVLDPETFLGQGRAVPGGAATVLDLPLNPNKDLKSVTLRTLANEVVIGLMGATLAH
jgi:hypothetical protein